MRLPLIAQANTARRSSSIWSDSTAWFGHPNGFDVPVPEPSAV
jgi:hypothetical protein